MNNIGARLKEIRIEKGLTQEQLAKKVGCGDKAISRYEQNDNLNKVYDFVKICQYLNADLNYIATGVKYNNKKEISLQEQQILFRYKKLCDSDKRVVDFILGIGEFEIEQKVANITSIPVYRFPVYEQQASAGAGITGRDGKFLMYDLFTTDIPQNAVFGVHIKGNSMVNTEPQLRIEDVPDGSIVLLNSKVNISDLNKTIVVASINDEVVCKYFLIEKDGWRFYSLNRIEHAGDDRFVRTSEEHKCRIIGQVVKVVKPSEFE